MMREGSDVGVKGCLLPSRTSGRVVGVGHLTHDSIKVDILQTSFCLGMLNIGDVTDMLRLFKHVVELLDCVFPSAKSADLMMR
jgi:hypothetical protein